jgi:hypothetical protein
MIFGPKNDGTYVLELKTDPALLLEAARRLEVEPLRLKERLDDHRATARCRSCSIRSKSTRARRSQFLCGRRPSRFRTVRSGLSRRARLAAGEYRLCPDPHVWSGRALQEDFVEWAVSGLASMYQALIGACRAPGHHGYQRACDLVSGQTSMGRVGHQCSHAPERPVLHLVSNPLADLGR